MAQVAPNMKYVRLGKSGLKVSQVILGCMTYGTDKWYPWILNEEESIEHIKTAYDLGINAFETCNAYSNGFSEIAIGKAIKKYNLPRDEIVVLTQFYLPVRHDRYESGFFFGNEEEAAKQRYTNQIGSSRKLIFDAIKGSLERLQLDYVDVYQAGRFDKNTPIEETMQALHDIVKAGYARYIGMGSCYAWQFHKMQAYAKANGLTEFISMQNFYNAAYREEEREMVPMLQDLGVGMIPWSPLCRGFLARPVETEGTKRAEADGFFGLAIGQQENAAKDAAITINKRISEIANKKGVSMAQVALAWLISKPLVSAPIVGTTSIDKMKDLVAGIHLNLTDEEVKYIDEPYVPRSIIGHS